MDSAYETLKAAYGHDSAMMQIRLANSALGEAGGQGISLFGNGKARDAEQEQAYQQVMALKDDRAEADSVVQLIDLRRQLDGLDGMLETLQVTDPPRAAAIEQMRQDFNYALLSKDAYFDESIDGLLPRGFTRATTDADYTSAGLTPELMQDERSGFFAALYQNQASGARVIAFRGTDGIARNDWDTNQAQARGLETDQYDRAMKIGQLAAKALGDDISFTGHSLGGGLAAAAALVSNKQAVTFNAAGLNELTVGRRGVTLARAPDLLRAYNVEGDLLSSVQDSLMFGGLVGHDLIPSAAGRRIQLSPAGGFLQGLQSMAAMASSSARLYQGYSLHGINNVLTALGSSIQQLSPMTPYKGH